jgi:hypothetical protein
MDTNALAISLGNGLAVGVVVMFIILIYTLPASATMNAFIYHHPVLRLLLGFVGGLGSIFTLIILLVTRLGKERLHYFGLFPIIQVGAPAAGPDGWFAFLFKALNAFRDYLCMNFYTPADIAGYERAVGSLLVPIPPAAEIKTVTLGSQDVNFHKGIVCEEFDEAARAAGAAPASKWREMINEISDSGIGQVLYSSL